MYKTFAVSRYQEYKEEIETSDEVILEIDPETVTTLSWSIDGQSLDFHKDESWLYDGDEAFPVDDEKITELLDQFSEFGVAFIIENVEDYAQYGLDSPECTIDLATADQSYEIKLGDFSKMDEQRYVDIGDGNVYLVSNDPMESFDVELSDLILDDEIPALTRSPRSPSPAQKTTPSPMKRKAARAILPMTSTSIRTASRWIPAWWTAICPA